jgi:hypothetical protein
MTCNKAFPLLNALTDHALPVWQSWRVRRHLAACPACTAELTHIQRLDSSLLAWHEAPAPAGLGARIAAALPPAAPNVVRRHFPFRPAAVGLAGVSAALAAVFWFLPGQPGQPTLAFADVEKAMQQVQTVSWEWTDQPDTSLNKNKQNVPTRMRLMRVAKWLRRNPPALAEMADLTLSPGLDEKVLYDKRGRFFLSKRGCMIWYFPKDPIQENVENTLSSFTSLPQAMPTITFGGTVRANVTNMHESHVVFEGQDRIRFDRDVTTRFFSKGTGASAFFESGHNTSHVSTWVDPATLRVTRIESHVFQDTHRGDVSLAYTVIEDHFQYNQTPPPGVFDWSPPAGAKVRRF